MPVQSVSQISTLRLKPTQEKSAKIGAEWSEKIKAQSLFSARTTERSYLDDVRKTLKAVAGRDLTPQQAEIKLRASLAKLGYTAQHGFPNAPDIAVGVKGSVTDLSSTARLRLIMDTNIKQARSMSQLASSQDPIFKMANPAWRLTRVGMREKPRPDWAERWQAAGDAVGWQGAIRSTKDFVALKDSPIWEALGDGAGGFTDTLKSPYPPFAFGSGMGWVNVGRRECKRLGLDLTTSDPSKEEVQAYVQKSQDGFDPTRDLGAELPAQYQDAREGGKNAPPFAPNLSKGAEAAKAVERAQAAILAALTHLESAVAEAYASVNAAEELLDEAKAAGLPTQTAAIDAVVKAIQDAQATIAGSLGGAAQGVANLSQSLALQPIPTSNDAQQAYDAACGLLATEAGKYADSAKTQQRAANGLVSQARGLRDKIKAEIAVRVKNECETYLKATETLLASLADKWNAAKAEGETSRKSHQELAKRWKKLSEATQGATADEKRVCDTAEDKFKKQGNIIITDVYRAQKDLAPIKSKVASGATVQDLTGKDDVRSQLRTLGAKWQAKTEKDIVAYKAMLDALRQADAALEEAIKRAEAGYKWVLTKWQTAREYSIKVAATCQDLIAKIGEKAKEWEKTLTDARALISMLKTVQNASADYVKGVDIDEIRKLVDGADASHATFKVKAHLGEVEQIAGRLDALKSQPADPAKQDEFDERCETFHDDLKAVAGELATVEKMLTRNIKSDLKTKMAVAENNLGSNMNNIRIDAEAAKDAVLPDIFATLNDFLRLEAEANNL